MFSPGRRVELGIVGAIAGPSLHAPLHMVLPLCVTVVLGLLHFGFLHAIDETLLAAILVLGAATALYVWRHAWRVYHYIADTATSRVASAAQGLVELHGTGQLPEGVVAQGHAYGPPSLWFSYTVTRDERVIDSGVSCSPFALHDGSGSCLVYPEGATVISSEKNTTRWGARRIDLEYLAPGADIYVLGELRTVGGDNDRYDPELEVRDTLRQWKRDQEALVAAFDSDGDGRIDAEEWEQARAAALRQAHADIAKRRRDTPVTHELHPPRSGLPMIISDRDPDYLQRRFYWLGLYNILLAAACLVSFAR